MKSLGYTKLKKILLATLAATLYLPAISVQAAEDLKVEPVIPTNADEDDISNLEESYNDLEVQSGDYNNIYGGGDETYTGESARNRLRFFGDTANGIFGGMSTIGDVHRNYIEILGGNISGGVIGGVAYFPYDINNSAGNVYDNHVNVSGGTVNFVSGGEVAYTYPNSGSFTLDTTQERFLSGGNVFNNSVNITGGTVSSGIVGGSSLSGKAYDNSITISGGTISGNVIGGEVRYPNSNSEVTGNVIEIYGSPNLNNATLIGGFLGNAYSATGNSLNIHTAGITARNIQGFESVNFWIPETHINDTSGQILTLTNGTTSLNLDKVNVFSPGNVALNKDDTINLLYNANGLDTSLSDSSSSADVVGNASYAGSIIKGSTSVYDLNLSTSADATSLMGTVDERSGDTDIVDTIPRTGLVNPIAVPPTPYIPPLEDVVFKTDADGYFLEPSDKVETNEFAESEEDFSEPSDEVETTTNDESEEDYNSDKAELKDIVREVRGFELFLDIGASSMRTKTGNASKIKATTQNYDIGIGRIIENQSSKNYFAPLFEQHNSDYDSYVKNNKNGNGEAKYTAGGFIMRHMQNNGMYYEGSIRAGRAKNEFSTDNFMINDVPVHLSYSMSAPLYSGHVRVGNFMRLSPSVICDVYGIYSYTRQNDMSSDLSTGEHVEFDSIHAVRVKCGYRMTTRTSRISRVYTGLAYQYDANSDSTARSDDWEHTSSGAKGHSGMIELGWQIKPNKDVPLMVDIYATGWCGYHRGATAMAKIRKSF